MLYFGIAIAVLFVAGIAIFVVTHLRKKYAGGGEGRKLDLALVGLNQQIKKNPNDAAAFTKRGTVRFRKGDVKGALADLEHAIELDPAAAEAHYQHAGVLQSTGDRAGAEKEYNWILQHSEDPYFKTAVHDRLVALRKGRR